MIWFAVFMAGIVVGLIFGYALSEIQHEGDFDWPEGWGGY